MFYQLKRPTTAATIGQKEKVTVKKAINSVLALVFVLSLGSLAFAQNTNSSTTETTNTTMSGGMMKHHRKHKRHHRKMMHKKMGGTMNSNT